MWFLDQEAQSLAGRKLMRRQEKKAELGEGKMGPGKRGEKLQSNHSKHYQVPGLLWFRRFPVTGLFIVGFPLNWDGLYAQENQWFCSLLTGKASSPFFLVGSHSESRKLITPELDTLKGRSFKTHIFWALAWSCLSLLLHTWKDY